MARPLVPVIKTEYDYVLRHAEREMQLINLVQQSPGLRLTAIAEKMGVSRTTICKLLAKFKEDQLIIENNRGHYLNENF